MPPVFYYFLLILLFLVTCGCQLHISLYKCFPLLLQHLTWDQSCATTLNMTSLRSTENVQYFQKHTRIAVFNVIFISKCIFAVVKHYKEASKCYFYTSPATS